MRLLTALLAATLPLSTGQDALVQLLPAGEFAARDGRPTADQVAGRRWVLSDTDGAALAAEVNRVAAANPLVIDYEHQTLHAAANGRPAPASGWIRRVQWVPGKGLLGNVEWTAAARAAIDAGEYRYISPVIHFDPAGRVTGLAMAALTNFPALLGMDAVVAQLNTQLHLQETDMALLAALVGLMGLPATTTEAELQAAIAALKTKADAPPKALVPAALVAELGLQAGADELAALSAVKTLKTADQGTNALVVKLTQDVAALTTQLNSGALTQAVDGAIAAGKFTPAHRDWLMAQGQRDMAALRGLIDSAPVIPGLAGQKPAGGDNPGGSGGAAALSATQALIAKQLGIAPDAYAKQLKAAAAA